MGLLSAISKGLDYLSAPLSQPLTFITKGPTAAAAAVSTSRAKISAGDKGEAAKVIGKTLLSTAVIGAGVVAAAPATALAGSSTAAKVLTTTKTATTAALKVPAVKKTAAIVATAAVVAPQTFSAIASKPAVAKTVIAAAVNPVLGVATAIEQGTSLLKEAVIENKEGLKTAGTIAAGAVVAGAGIIAVDKSIDYFKNLKEEEKVGGVLGTGDLPKEIKTPETQELKPTPVEKAPTNGTAAPRMSQKVVVNVSQRQTKKYLNAGVYINRNGRLR